jgi:hypothetical protein
MAPLRRSTNGSDACLIGDRNHRPRAPSVCVISTAAPRSATCSPTPPPSAADIDRVPGDPAAWRRRGRPSQLW